MQPRRTDVLVSQHTSRVAVRALAVWLSILACASLNGFIREALLVPSWGRTPGLLASGLLLCAVVLAVACATTPWIGVRDTRRAGAVGGGWLALTVVFEWTFGLLRGASWRALIAPYTFADGNLWLLVLLVTALAPLIAYHLRR